MHLVIWSSFRSGSHMLRSMLSADPRVVDTGEFLEPAGFKAFLNDQAAVHPGKIILSNPKWGMGVLPILPRVNALSAAKAKVILLHRRDLLAQQASWALAGKTGAFRGRQAPSGTMVELDPEAAGRAMFHHALQLEQLRLSLQKLPHVVLAYEDITLTSVASALASLDIDIDVAEPNTRKSAPQFLADFVTNLLETS